MEFYDFVSALKELKIDEDALKSLVSHGEIRAYRDADKMKFKKSDIARLKQRMSDPQFVFPKEGATSSGCVTLLLSGMSTLYCFTPLFWL